MKKNAIALHRNELEDTGYDLSSIGDIGHFARDAHRDDHYMFILQSKGSCTWELDFTEVRLTGPCLCYVTPGQVHRLVHIKNSEGWLLFADAGLLPAPVREVFDTYLNNRQFASLLRDDPCMQLATVLQSLLLLPSTPLVHASILSLIGSLTGLIASGIVHSHHNSAFVSTQKYSLTVAFKQLVAQHFKELKLVRDYSSLLNITPLYLNEVVKAITGFPASHWIQQETLLESKRLLYYTSSDIKEIAFDLGFDDHAYFSRFFKKHTGLTASAFRSKKP